MSGASTPDAVAEMAHRIRTYLVENFLLGQADGLDDASSLLDSGILDSTGVLEVVAFLEETFEIKVDEEDLVAANLDTVQDLARFVARKRAVGAETLG
jgi:acyl carrier protein